ncbi:MAG: hypothetical protein ACRDP9_03910 [Kribbellaceae bacterium]
MNAGCGLAGRPEVPLDPDVQLGVAVDEPAATTHGEQWRLGDLCHAEPVGVERPGHVLATGRAGHLHMVESHHATF